VERERQKNWDKQERRAAHARRHWNAKPAICGDLSQTSPEFGTMVEEINSQVYSRPCVINSSGLLLIVSAKIQQVFQTPSLASSDRTSNFNKTTLRPSLGNAPFRPWLRRNSCRRVIYSEAFECEMASDKIV
jgi:hypothetical protein